MKFPSAIRFPLIFVQALLVLLFSHAATATVVEVRTVEGNFQVNLFDETTPQTVQNFLNYVNSGAYANNVVHRSVDNFVIQMGGYQYNDGFPLDTVPTDVPVINEPELSNVRGTLAMAKLGGDPDSATSQFFVNLSDNSTSGASLDTQNGGFTVFGQVIGDGMDVVDRIAALPQFNLGGVLAETPLRNYTAQDATNGVTPGEDNIVIISDIVVIDSATLTNPDLNPAQNTAIDAVGNPPVVDVPSSSSSGGSGSLWLLLSLGLIVFCRRFVAFR